MEYQIKNLLNINVYRHNTKSNKISQYKSFKIIAMNW